MSPLFFPPIIPYPILAVGEGAASAYEIERKRQITVQSAKHAAGRIARIWDGIREANLDCGDALPIAITVSSEPRGRKR